jgi:hypothetical protein
VNITPARMALVLAALTLFTLAPTAFAGGADTITVVQRQVDANPDETNPCTGATGTIVDDEQDVFHVTTLADGTLRLSGHSTVAVTFVPDDPTGVLYAGHETFAFNEIGTPHLFTTTMTTSVRVRGTDGTFLTSREVSHLTVTNSGVAAEFDRPTLECPLPTPGP